MSKRTTIYDLAKATGLSTATVHRALNGKDRVSEETRRRVTEAAQALDYQPNTLARRLSSRPLRLAVVCERVLPEFYDAICRGAQRAFDELRDYNVLGQCVRVDMHDAAAFRETMLGLCDAGVDGIALSAAREDAFACELVNELARRGVTVATLISDLSAKRAFCIRSDGYTSGRTAYQMLWWMLGGKGSVAMFTRSKDACIHRQIIDGFQSMQRELPLEVAGIFENNDDPQMAYDATDLLIRRYPDVGGLYIGSANAVTVLKRLEELGVGGKIRVIASDLFPQLEGYFHSGILDATIFQDPFVQARKCVNRLYRRLVEGTQYEEITLLQSSLVMRSNLETYQRLVAQGDPEEEAKG